MFFIPDFFLESDHSARAKLRKQIDQFWFIKSNFLSKHAQSKITFPDDYMEYDISTPFSVDQALHDWKLDFIQILKNPALRPNGLHREELDTKALPHLALVQKAEAGELTASETLSLWSTAFNDIVVVVKNSWSISSWLQHWLQQLASFREVIPILFHIPVSSIFI